MPDEAGLLADSVIDQPALAQFFDALRSVRPEAAARASSALARILSWRGSSQWPEVAWAFSSLTASGFPVEFSFSTLDSAVRYVAEVAPPELPEANRPAAACRFFEMAGHLPELIPRLEALQQGGPLRFGAWIGGRHDAHHDRFKLYAEVPDVDTSLARAYVEQTLGVATLLADRPAQLRMVGFDPASSRLELYFRTQRLEMRHLYRLLEIVELRPRTSELIDFIQTQRRWGDPPRLPGAKFGFSYSLSLAGGAPVFSLFLSARRLWGDDRRIRRQLATLAEQNQWDLRDYLAVTEPIEDRQSYPNYHSLISVCLAPDAALFLQVGLQPFAS